MDKGQHVSRCHGGRIPVDDREEDLQVERGGEHSVPPSAARDELQKRIEEGMTEADPLATRGRGRVLQTGHEPQGPTSSGGVDLTLLPTLTDER